MEETVKLNIVSDKVRKDKIGTIYIKTNIYKHWVEENIKRERLIEEKKLNPIEQESCYLLEDYHDDLIVIAISELEALLHHFEPHRQPYSYEITWDTEEEIELSKISKNSIFF